MIARILAVMLGCALGMGVFGVGEVVAHSGLSPFEAAVAVPSSPLPATDGSGMGTGE